MNQVTIVPFVKWIGGKRKLLPELLKRMPKKYNRYFEPFVGGGALFFDLKPRQAVINDLNKELMDAYNIIRNRHKILIEILWLMEKYHRHLEIHNNPKMFNDLRDMGNRKSGNSPFLNSKLSKLLSTARFIYLNKTVFNGLYRVNKNGDFNVPNGKRKNVNIYKHENIKNISSFLKGKNNDIKIFNKSFEKVCAMAEKNDFLYLDPPYDYEIGQKSFDGYLKTNFAIKGQKLLAKVCQELNQKGAKFMTSNHNTQLIRELYKDFKIEVVEVRRLVGGKYASRKKVEDVIIRNYE